MGFEHTRKTAECNPGVDVYSYTTLSKSLYGPKLRFMVPLYDLWVFFAMVLRSVYKELHADHETGAADNK